MSAIYRTSFQPSAIFIPQCSSTNGPLLILLRAEGFTTPGPSPSANIIRILVVDQMAPSIKAFASDSGIDKVVSSAEATINLASAIEMVRVGIDGSELKTLMRDIAQGNVEYTQDAIDEKIQEAFDKFGHDKTVRLSTAIS